MMAVLPEIQLVVEWLPGTREILEKVLDQNRMILEQNAKIIEILKMPPLVAREALPKDEILK